MLNRNEMHSMMKLRNKRKDKEAQEQFYTWYNTLTPDDKRQFDKFCRKSTYISIAAVVIIFGLIGSCMSKRYTICCTAFSVCISYCR